MGRIGLCIGVMAAFGCADLATAKEIVAQIPRAALFGSAQRANVSQSPDGKWLSWLAPLGGVMNVWVSPFDDPARARPVTHATKRPIPAYGWTPDSATVLYVTDEGGNENFTLDGVDLASGAVRNFTPYKDVRVGVVGFSHTLRDRALILLNNRAPAWHDVYEVNFRTGELKLIRQNDSFVGFTSDDALRLRLAIRPRPDSGRDFLRITDGAVEHTPIDTVGYDDVSTTSPVGFDRGGAVLYWLDTRGRDKAALVAEDIATGKKTVLAQDLHGDVATPLVDPNTGRVDAYSVDDLRRTWVALDPKVKADIAFLQSHLKGRLTISPLSDPNDRWIVEEDPVSAPQAAWRYDRSPRRLTRLFSLRPELEGAPLADMQPVEIRARDGLRLVSYLTLPIGSAGDGALRPARPLPLVLVVHGGPADRDSYQFEPLHQWLANRGYAVLSVNFRGSSGLGKQLLQAGELEWGAKMQDDLIDAVDWAVKAGIADPRKVAIFGGSYGGYAVLAGLAFTPDRFACGVDMYGPSDLESLARTLPAYWTPRRAELMRKMGDPSTPEGAERMKARSPLFRADAVKAPLLVGQGANDMRVNKAESDKMVAALQHRNVPVTYLVFSDEGHGIMSFRPQNKLAFMAVAEQFLAKCLGGRSEPIGDSFVGSSVRVETGAEYVPGLAEAVHNQPVAAMPPTASGGPNGEVLALVGDWSGTMPIQPPLHVTVHVRQAAGEVRATLDSPERGLRDLPLSDFRRAGSTVTFAIPAVGFQYEGQLAADANTLRGSVHQGSAPPQPLVLSRSAAADSAAATERKVITVAPELLARYAGRYQLLPNVQIVFSLEGDRFYGSLTGGRKFELFAESSTQFFAKDADGRAAFQTDNDGRVTSVQVTINGQQYTAPRVEEARQDGAARP